MAGEPFVSNVAAGIELANSLHPGMIVLEGSGAAVPPVGADARLLVAGAHQPLEHITGYLGTYRLLVSDAMVLTMAEEPLASAEKVQALVERVGGVRPGMCVVPVVFRPRPLESVEGRRVAFFSTAPPAQEAVLRRHLEEECGCQVELLSTHLADRAALRNDFERPAMSRVDVVLTEIKAAAIDVVAEEAAARGLSVVPVDNVPVEAAVDSQGRLAELARELGEMAKQRYESRT
jgi:cyclic 2,3-diphosphoglycerate synthetase